MRRIIIISLLSLAACSPSTHEPTTLPPLSLAPPSTSSTTTSTTTTTTTVPPTTTTTIDPLIAVVDEMVANQAIIYPRCAEWLPLLLKVGGRLEDWGTWSTVIWTESRCKPDAINPSHNCFGLTQLFYRVHQAWLTDLGYGQADLLDPEINLRFAVMLQASSGWSPWAYLNKP